MTSNTTVWIGTSLISLISLCLLIVVASIINEEKTKKAISLVFKEVWFFMKFVIIPIILLVSVCAIGIYVCDKTGISDSMLDMTSAFHGFVIIFVVAYIIITIIKWIIGFVAVTGHNAIKKKGS